MPHQYIYTHQHYHHNQYSLQSYNLRYPLLPLLEKFRVQESFTKEEYFAQFRGLSKALACLHEKAIHRDIKPDNILISNGRWQSAFLNTPVGCILLTINQNIDAN
jgi:serine/threonine-protein kinase